MMPSWGKVFKDIEISENCNVKQFWLFSPKWYLNDLSDCLCTSGSFEPVIIWNITHFLRNWRREEKISFILTLHCVLPCLVTFNGTWLLMFPCRRSCHVSLCWTREEVENDFKIYSKLSSLPYFITNSWIEMHLFKFQTLLCFIIHMSTLQEPTAAFLI